MSQIFFAALEVVVHVFDIVAFPISWIVWRPWARIKAREEYRSKVRTGVGEIEFQAQPLSCRSREEVFRWPKKIDTVDKLFERALSLFGPSKCLGTRKILRTFKVQNSDDVVLTKLDLADDYTWMTYGQVGHRVERLTLGLHSMGLRPGDKVMIYADTCAEWLMTSLACFKSSLPIVTIYTNLGQSGVSFSVNQIGGSVLVTSQELLPKVADMVKDWPTVTTVIYFENEVKCGTQVDWLHPHVRLVPFRQVDVQSQTPSAAVVRNPEPEDVAVIMYTSGSTGQPKGVMLTHANLLSSLLNACVLGCNLIGEDRSADEAYLAYLPLAHIFELTHEILVLSLGIKVGYSSPNTLTDSSTMIVSGQKGDASILQPTAMPCVPIILDRIYKGIRAKIQARGAFFQRFFDFCYRYRRYWVSKGFDTPILNAVVFKKFQMALGGKMKAIIAGGAPLSPDVHEFLRICLRVNLAQGYGLTETVGGISLSDSDDLSVGCVGRPLPDVRIKLQNWEEGGYTVNDEQGPRGEIIVGGPLVAKGYYDLPDKTAESFYEENGTRWFRTGDIGQLSKHGTLQIIDRKKDLVKLQMGEYISLGKVEACLKVHPLVDNVCVYADSTKTMSVALVVPNAPELISLASINGSKSNLEEICRQPSVIAMAFTELRNFAMKHLEKFEIPKQMTFVPDVWTPDTELVTAAMKLKRKHIQKKYQMLIDRMYQTLEDDQNQK